MNQLMLVALAVVAFCYFGGNNCPSVLRQNKEMLLGVLVGLVLCSFMGLRLEGYGHDMFGSHVVSAAEREARAAASAERIAFATEHSGR
jgi:hypothetical protein